MADRNINAPVMADIIVSGAGPAGLALSCLLAKAGLRVALIDAERPSSAGTRPSGRTAALFNGSVNILKACGVWGDLDAMCAPLETMRIVDGETKLEFHAEDIGEKQFGQNVPNAALRNSLLKQTEQLPLLIHLCPAKLASYKSDDGGIIAETDAGHVIRGKLIVGTDGRNSVVRKIAGISAKTRDYGQIAITCLLAHTRPHDHASTEFHYPGGPFTLVPLPDNKSSLVWVEKTDDAKRFLSMKQNAFVRAVQDRSHGLLGEISVISPPESWPLMYLSAESIVAERAVLAAEAAHVLSPLGAQGLNLSLRDVAVLAECIVDAARCGEDIGASKVLSGYARRRKADMALRSNGIDHYNRIVASDYAIVRQAKKFGIGAVSGFAPLKDFAADQALSPSLGGSRLIAGDSL